MGILSVLAQMSSWTQRMSRVNSWGQRSKVKLTIIKLMFRLNSIIQFIWLIMTQLTDRIMTTNSSHFISKRSKASFTVPFSFSAKKHFSGLFILNAIIWKQKLWSFSFCSNIHVRSILSTASHSMLCSCSVSTWYPALKIPLLVLHLGRSLESESSSFCALFISRPAIPAHTLTGGKLSKLIETRCNNGAHSHVFLKMWIGLPV